MVIFIFYNNLGKYNLNKIFISNYLVNTNIYVCIYIYIRDFQITFMNYNFFFIVI